MIATTEKWAGGKGINVVLDLAGGPYVKAFQKLLSLKGRMMLVGTVAGGAYEREPRYMLSKRLSVRGPALRARTLEETVEVTQAFAAEAVPLLATGVMRRVTVGIFELAQRARDHAQQ